MKKTILPILLAILCGTAATAQTEKGNVLIGAGLADINAGIMKGGDAIDYFSISLYPRAGFFVKKNFALGANVGLGLAKSGPITTYSYGIQPFARYYLGPKKTKFFGEAGVGYFGNTTYGAPWWVDRNQSGVMFTIGPGVSYFINQNVGIETSLLVRGVHMGYTKGIEYHPSLSVGFQIYLRGKHRTTKEPRFIETLPQEDKDE